NDAESGALPASALRWSVVMQHCPSNRHQHMVTEYSSVSGGTLVAPDHEYPSWLELRLTATDPSGLEATTSVALQPQTTSLAFQSSPSGLQLAVNATAGVTPFNRSVIVGSVNTISALSPQ